MGGGPTGVSGFFFLSKHFDRKNEIFRASCVFFNAHGFFLGSFSLFLVCKFVREVENKRLLYRINICFLSVSAWKVVIRSQ